MLSPKALFNDLQSTPNRYFKNKGLHLKSKPSTANPILHRKNKLSMGDMQTPVKLFITHNDHPFVMRDTLTNLMRDCVTPSPKQFIHIKFNAPLRKKSKSITPAQIWKELNDYENGVGEFSQRENELQMMRNEKKDGVGNEDIFIKRKEFAIKNYPARFGLKLPDSVDNCRKLISRKDFRVETSKNQNPIDLSKILQSHLEKQTYRKASIMKKQKSCRSEGPENEYFRFGGKKTETNEIIFNEKGVLKKKITLKSEEFRNIKQEEDDDKEIAIFLKKFGPASPYFDLEKLNKRKTQKDILQSAIQRKKTMIGEGPQVSLNKPDNKEKNDEEEDEEIPNGETEKKKKEKNILDEMKSKRFKNIIDDGKKRSMKHILKSLRESLSYFASLKLDLSEVISYTFYKKIHKAYSL